MASRRPAIVIPMQQTGLGRGGETTLSREINPRDRRCFQRIISFGSESRPPAGCLAAIFSLSLPSLSLLSTAEFILVAISAPVPSCREVNRRVWYKTQVNEIYLTTLGFRGKAQLFPLREGGSETFPRKERCDGLTSFHGRDKPDEAGRGRKATVLRVKTGQGWRKKNKVRAFPRERSREWRENVSICGTESDFFQVHLPSFILRGYSPLDFTLVCDFHAEELGVFRLALLGSTQKDRCSLSVDPPERIARTIADFPRRTKWRLNATLIFVPARRWNRTLIIMNYSSLLYFPCVTFFGKYEIYYRLLNIQSMLNSFFSSAGAWGRKILTS